MRKAKQRELNRLDETGVGTVTLDDLEALDRQWLENRNRAAGTIYLSGLALKYLREITGETDAAKITRAHVETYIEARRKGGAGGRAMNREVAYLRATWNRAVQAGTLTVNPFKAATKINTDPVPIIPLTPDEEGRLLAACGDDLELECFVRVALDTGARAGEISHLRIDALDLGAGLGRVTCNTEWKTKNRRDKWVAFTPETVERLRTWIARRPFKPYVFREEDDGPRDHYDRIGRRFKAAVKTAKIGRKVTLHDCRRTVGSLLAAQGVNERVAQEVLGHSSIATTAQFYQAVDPATIRRAVLGLRASGRAG